MRALVLSSFYRDPVNRSKLRTLVGLGVDLTVAVPGGSAETDAGVRIAPVEVKGDPAVPAELEWHAGTIKRLISELRPDLIQIEEDPGSPLAHTAAKFGHKMAVPVVLMSWRSLPFKEGFLARRRATAVLKWAGAVIGGNSRATDFLAGMAPTARRDSIVQAGVVPSAWSPRPVPEELRIGFVGRLVPERRAEFLIQALGQTYGHWRLDVVGTGPEQEALETLVQRLGLASRVRWLGGIRQDVLDQLWPEIDCLVLPWQDTPTWVEAHSPTLLEAMGRGIAPVVTRAGALPELIGADNPKTSAGVVVDTVDELTEILQAWVAQPAKCVALGGRARQRVLDQYIDSAIASRTLELWRQVVGAKEPGSST